MTLSFWLDSPAEKRRMECDVAIIGGGIIGASAAYWLGKRKNLRVAIIERGRLASGASGRNGGFVLRGIQAYYNQAVRTYGRDTARLVYAFTEETQALLAEFAGKPGVDFDYEPCGSYLLACSLEELQDLDESAALLAEDGFACEFLKEDPLERDFYGALFNPSDAAVHPARLVRALISASGAEVFEGEPVTRVDAHSASLAVQTPHYSFVCPRVLLAANAYAPFLEPWFADKIKPARGQVLVTQPLGERLLDRLCYANYGWEYFRQLADGRLLLGGCRELDLEEEATYAEETTPRVQTALEHYLKDRFPELAGVPVDYRWAGIMAFTSDGLPLVGSLRKLPGMHFAVAMNGHGMGFSLAMGRLLVEAAMEGRKPGIFDAERPGLLEQKRQVPSAEGNPYSSP